MHIAIVNLTGGGLSGGYQNYLRKLLPLLAQDRRITALDVFFPYSYVALFQSDLFSSHAMPIGRLPYAFNHLKKRVHECHPDVVFIPTARWIDCGKVPVVSMVRNMEAVLKPFVDNSLVDCLKNIRRMQLARHACRKTQRVIAVSKFVQNFLIDKWHVDRSRIGMVYHGVDNGLDFFDDEFCHNPLQESLSKFLFTAGSIRSYRGLEDIILAMEHLKETDHELKLVIAGRPDPGSESYEARLRNMAGTLGVQNRVVWMGHLNDKQMGWFYRNCELFVMTSRIEACPNVALEAMSHGCVNIIADNPPLPEFFGDAAVYYPPKDGKALGEAISRVLSWDNEKKRTMSERARSRASQFSWDVCAKKTVEELKLAVEQFVQRGEGR